MRKRILVLLMLFCWLAKTGIGQSCLSSVNLNIVPSPVPDITGNLDFCTGGSATLYVQSGFSSYAWSNGNGTPSITVTSHGIYTVTVTNATGCSGTDQVMVTTSPGETPNITANPYQCNGQLTLDAGAGYINYAWSNTGNGQTTAVNSTGTYTVTVTNANGCTGTDDFTVTIPPVPVVNISGNLSFCSNNSTQLSATAGFASYLWSNGNTNQNQTINTGGNYSVTATDAFGCTDDATVFVQENPFTDPTISGGSLLCPGGTLFLTADGPNYQSYAWSNGQNTQAITVSAPGTYNVTVTATNGCTGTESATVQAGNPVNASITGNPVICPGGSTTLTVTGSFSTYDWSNGQSGPTITVAQANLYTVTVTTNQGCTGTASINTSLGTPPNVNITPVNQPICEGGNPIQLQATPSGGLWSGDVGSNGVIVPATLGPGTFQATYTYVDPNGCIGDDQMPFNILPLTAVAIQPVGPFCPNDPIQTLAASPPGGTWGGAANSSGQIDPVTLGPGVFQVIYSATLPGSCPNQSLATVEINPQPTASIAGTATVCQGSGISIPLNLNITGNGIVEVTYTINGMSPTVVSFPAGPATLNATEPGIYQLVNVVDAAGCTGAGSGSGQVLVAPDLTTNNFDIQCNPTAGTYIVSFTVAGGDPASYTVNSANLAGPPYQYTSAPIASGNNYQFTITDANDCSPIQLSGSFNCNCATNAGNMNLTPLTLCEGTAAVASFNNNAQLDTDDALVFILHSGNGNTLGTVYGTNTTPNFPFAPPLVTGQNYYISAVAGNSNGAGSVDLNDPCLSVSFGTPVNWTPAPNGSLMSNTTICAGETATLVFSLTGSGPFNLSYSNGSQPLSLQNVINNASITVSPASTTVYTLQQVALSNIPTCSSSTNSSVTVTVISIAPTNLSATICDGQSIFLGGASQSQAGTYTDTLSSVVGCDSVLLTTLSIHPIDTSYVNDTSCDPSQTGVFTTVFAAQNGCDSVVITTIIFSATDSTFLTQVTCDPSQAGVFYQSFTSQLGCDSVVTTTVTLLPSDTTTIFDTSCDPSQTGVFTTVFAAQNGCDSVVISTITYSATDSTFLSQTTCDPAQAGVFVQSFTSQLGCDSIVTTAVTLLPSTTTNVFGTSCDPSQTGVFTNIFTAQNGCDSIVVSTITYSESDSTFLSQTTCDPAQAGIFTQNLTNQIGCDSIVTTTVTLLPSTTTNIFDTSCDPSQTGVFATVFISQNGCDSVVISTIAYSATDSTFFSQTTCDPAQTGVFTQSFTNQLGCDSLVITTVTLLPTDNISISSTTCDPTQAGVFIQNLMNASGCDSTVTTTVALLPIDTTFLTSATCDPSQLGTSTNVFQNWYGCDSVVVSTVTLTNPPLVTLDAADFGGFGVSCNGASDGRVQASVTGTAPFFFAWQGGATTPLIEDLSPGNYSVTVTDGNGCTTASVVELTGPNPLTNALSINALDCFGDATGAITANAVGGVPAYQYSLNAGPFQDSGLFGGLSAGAYQITTQDANGCTATDLVAINSPVSLSVDLGDDIFLELGDGAALSALTNVPLDSLSNINWSGINNPECPECPNQKVFPVITTAYTVTVVDAQGCIASDGLTVYVDKTKNIYVPNAFSPDGDGINDLFTVFAKEGQVKNVKSFLVFDRWGESVYKYFNFAPNNPAIGWDGSHRGELMDAAVFVWFAEVEFTDGSTELFEGDVMLMR